MQALAKRLDESFRREIDATMKEFNLAATMLLLKREGPTSANDITEFYKTYNPTKLDSVPELLRKYGRDLKGLEDTLHRKYGLENLDCTTRSRLRELARLELAAFYRRRGEEDKIAGIEDVVNKYDGKDDLAGLIRHVSTATVHSKPTAQTQRRRPPPAKKPAETRDGRDSATGQTNASDSKAPSVASVPSAPTNKSAESEHRGEKTKPAASGLSWGKKLGQLTTRAGQFLVGKSGSAGSVGGRSTGRGTAVASIPLADGNSRYNTAARLGQGYIMKTNAALRRLKWQRRHLEDCFARCDSAAARLQAELMPSWRQQHRFNQLCLEVSTPIQKVLPEDTTKAANDVANNGASAAGDARPPNPSPNATTSHGEPPIPVLCDLTAKRVSQIVRRAQTIEEKLLQLEKKRWARTVDDVRKSLKATHELMQAGNSTEHPPEPADNTDTNASASMAST